MKGLLAKIRARKGLGKRCRLCSWRGDSPDSNSSRATMDLFNKGLPAVPSALAPQTILWCLPTPISSKHTYLTYGRLGPGLGPGHEDTQESHYHQVDFIQGTALILLGDVLQAGAEPRSPVTLKLEASSRQDSLKPTSTKRLPRAIYI